jgi:hypothetical protein
VPVSPMRVITEVSGAAHGSVTGVAVVAVHGQMTRSGCCNAIPHRPSLM